jgi:Fe2+ transport system protein FeoA
LTESLKKGSMTDVRKTQAKTGHTPPTQPLRHPGRKSAPANAAALAGSGGSVPRKPLSEAPAGESVEVVEQELAGEEASLLSALGIVRGSRLVVRASGDPCIVEVRSARVGIARRVAARVIVQSTQR